MRRAADPAATVAGMRIRRPFLPHRHGLAWLCCLGAALWSPPGQAGELQQRVQWDSDLSLRSLALRRNAQLLSWQGDYYTDGGWAFFASLQRSLKQAVGSYALGAHYSGAAGGGEWQLGWHLQGYTGDSNLRQWNYHQLNASWLTERCAFSASWTLEDSPAEVFDYKGPALDLSCLQPLNKQLGLEFGLGVMGLRASTRQHFAHAGLSWRHDRLALRLLYNHAGMSSRERYLQPAEPHWSASASWSF